MIRAHIVQANCFLAFKFWWCIHVREPNRLLDILANCTQKIECNRLLLSVPNTAPGVDPAEVLAAGAANLRQAFMPEHWGWVGIHERVAANARDPIVTGGPAWWSLFLRHVVAFQRPGGEGEDLDGRNAAASGMVWASGPRETTPTRCQEPADLGSELGHAFPITFRYFLHYICFILTSSLHTAVFILRLETLI
jgi:hypothetical protein